jgi:hypothetical protein
MQCSKCDGELLIDHVDGDGKYYYVCMNKNCTEYRKAFNPSTGVETEANIKPMDKNTTT